jgi:tRNA(Ile)-lysidine synthase
LKEQVVQGPTLPEVERFHRDCAGLAGFSPDARLGLAVSGGPDSLALLLLAHAAFPGRIAAATVDHRLRPEAVEEAALVASICAALSVPHATLVPEAPITGSIQAAAREARYRLLGEWCKREGIGLLATAHHAHDQAETFLMRLLRGSGVAGLAGIRSEQRLAAAGDVAIVRPLLAWRREELAAIVARAGLVAADDPSNRDERFDRARLRRLIREADWLDPAAIARSAANLADAEDALDWTARRIATERITRLDERITFDPAGLPQELRRRLTLAILAELRLNEAEPRGEEVSRLLDRLAAGGKATLAGVLCQGGAIWRFSRAPARRSH